MDAKKVLQALKLKGDTENARVGVYMSKTLWKELQDFCEREHVSASSVISHLVREMLDSAKDSGKKK